jgi:predicted nucleotidyltransferase
MIIQEDLLEETVRLLRDRIHPDAIYLFGSQATGRASPHNGDVDLCIIVNDDREPYLTTVDAYETLQAMPFPKDIIVRRKGRFEERAEWPATLEHEVKKTGRLLYKV